MVDIFIPDTREAPLWTIGATALIVCCMLLLINFYLFPEGVLAPISLASRGLINSTLVANLLTVTALCAFWKSCGKMRWRDVQLARERLVPGLGTGLLFWLTNQVLVLVSAQVDDARIMLNPEMPQLVSGESLAFVGGLLSQLLGNGLYEEMVYRGYLIPQLLLKINKRTRCGPFTALLIAAMFAVLLFTMSHLPNVLYRGMPIRVLVIPLVIGAGFTVLYLLTGNLFLVLAIHAVANEPSLILVREEPTRSMTFHLTLAVFVVAFALLRVRRRIRNKL